MILPECVTWCDPGGMSGLAWLWLSGTAFFADEYPFEQVGDQIEATCARYRTGLVIGYERYRVDPSKPQTNANDAIQPIGLVRHYALRYGCRLVSANPGDRLTATRAMLTAIGWWVKGKDDAQSAAQHLLAWCEREHCTPPRERAILAECRRV